MRGRFLPTSPSVWHREKFKACALAFLLLQGEKRDPPCVPPLTEGTPEKLSERLKEGSIMLLQHPFARRVCESVQTFMSAPRRGQTPRGPGASRETRTQREWSQVEGVIARPSGEGGAWSARGRGFAAEGGAQKREGQGV